MEPTYSLSFHLELQRQTLALIDRDDLLALSARTANRPEARGESEGESAEGGTQFGTLDINDLLIEAAREMKSDWLEIWPVERIKKAAREASFGVLVLFGLALFTWVSLSQLF
jgi:hypothetical protein